MNVLHQRSADYHIPNENFVCGYLFMYARKNDHNDILLIKNTSRLSNVLYVCKLNGRDQIQPSASRSFTVTDVDEIRNALLKLNYPFHNRRERHVKVVIEASKQRVEFERREDLIR